jgi:alkylation response protein AidB-like acyl-CoA dehydrogenase
MISFQPTEDQKLVMETIQRFVKERVQKIRHDSDENRQLPAEVINEGWGLGLLAGWIPEEYGGLGEKHSAISGALYAEELAYGDLSLALTLLAPSLVGLPVLEYGTEEQKARWLPKLTEDKFTPLTAAFSEPNWNFDPNNPSTTATREGDNYVINGQKVLVPLAADAEVILVYATEDGKTQAFLVEKGTAGVNVSDREKNMGIQALPTYEVKFENCRVPASAKLGGEAGCDAQRLLNYSRVGMASLAVGVAKAALEYSQNYAKERQAFNRYIAQFQSIAFMLAEMAIEVDGARLLTWEAAWNLDQGHDALKEAVLAKNYADEMVLMVTDRSVQILGGHGYIREHPCEMFLRNARSFAVAPGLAMV